LVVAVVDQDGILVEVEVLVLSFLTQITQLDHIQ